MAIDFDAQQAIDGERMQAEYWHDRAKMHMDANAAKNQHARITAKSRVRVAEINAAARIETTKTSATSRENIAQWKIAADLYKHRDRMAGYDFIRQGMLSSNARSNDGFLAYLPLFVFFAGIAYILFIY
jgi:hypothetical protein